MCLLKFLINISFRHCPCTNKLNLKKHMHCDHVKGKTILLDPNTFPAAAPQHRHVGWA